MNTGLLSDWVVEQWMNVIDDLPYKGVALFSSDPFAAGTFSAVEVIGGSYARQAGTWVRASIRTLELDAGVVFRSLVPGTVVAAVGVVTDPFAGELVCRSMILNGSGVPTPITFPSGGSYPISAGNYVIGVDVPSGP